MAELAYLAAANPELIQYAVPVAQTGIQWGAILIGIIIFLVIAGIIVLVVLWSKKKSQNIHRNQIKVLEVQTQDLKVDRFINLNIYKC